MRWCPATWGLYSHMHHLLTAARALQQVGLKEQVGQLAAIRLKVLFKNPRLKGQRCFGRQNERRKKEAQRNVGIETLLHLRRGKIQALAAKLAGWSGPDSLNTHSPQPEPYYLEAHGAISNCNQPVMIRTALLEDHPGSPNIPSY